MADAALGFSALRVWRAGRSGFGTGWSRLSRLQSAHGPSPLLSAKRRFCLKCIDPGRCGHDREGQCLVRVRRPDFHPLWFSRPFFWISNMDLWQQCAYWLEEHPSVSVEVAQGGGAPPLAAG